MKQEMNTSDVDSTQQFSGYVACMIRQIPVDPGSETVVKLLNDETTIGELKQWIGKMNEGCTTVVEVKIVPAT